ncbi:dTDP-4-dehydrorhamnose 3,5-epimerase [Dokdonella fugitiva]|jgi:dTDP-4-dehydrorhamnose 3,5-epimerase|uniref:dTDP-4-dehydrorhamnose 3,5-epimerase n=1 Tax=Dokdonella fugitiva TaxID=328517 RepID=A0A4R2IG07_9GAMM|nr:dTDP-4-dehydrorhamnose 3,5-epimerase [Dokdonella fugitiva]TCO42638.1 dTDP-4-dehydrorhamnose 3,5-epimerase [Dokdonella fugitiva]
MIFVPTALAGLIEIRSHAAVDARGRFRRLFCERDLAVLREGLHFTQINLSQTRARGTVRGMHFQSPPAAEAKLIHCLRGRVFDVAVDVRRGSPTFLQWHACELSGDDDRALFIPEGFAHGFQSLSDEAELLYMHTAPWTPEFERGLRHDDPRIGIAWPLPVGAVSDRDRNHPLINERFSGVSP